MGEPRITLESLLAAQPARPLDVRTLAVGGADGPYLLELGGYAQFRYTASVRDDPPAGGPRLSHGLMVRRLKLGAEGHVGSPKFTYDFTFANRDGGGVFVEKAEFGWSPTERTSVHWGQFRPPLVHEVLTSGRHQLAADRSRVASVFGQGYSQGVQVTHECERWRGRVMLSDGLGAASTDFTNPGEADLALTGRVETRLGERPWGDYGRFVGFPGSARGAMLGAAGHFETAGDTGLGSPADRRLYQLTADATVKGGGWSGHGALHWRRAAGPGMAAADDLGALVQASRFIDDRNEVFARWGTIWPSGDRAGPADPFSTLTAGLKHYFIPTSNAVVAVADAQYLFDDFDGSGPLIGTSVSRGQIADTGDGQLVFRLQFQVSF